MVLPPTVIVKGSRLLRRVRLPLVSQSLAKQTDDSSPRFRKQCLRIVEKRDQMTLLALFQGPARVLRCGELTENCKQSAHQSISFVVPSWGRFTYQGSSMATLSDHPGTSAAKW